jgi:NADPH-dependent 2,4-dienoyl-CoA reductase/sulfur reductase-like enzyme
MTDQTELIIIGAGPAGIQAAITAAESGMQVTIIDSNPLPGGQYYKQIPEQFSMSDKSNHQREAYHLIKGLNNPSIRVLSKTLVWGIFHNPKTNMWQTTLHGENCPARLEAPTIIIASGAYDRSIPFPGWDLPGVITAGATQIMIKQQGILPGKRVIVSGTGPLQLAAASNLVDAGAQVVEILECNQNLVQKGFPHLLSAWGQWKRVQEGVEYGSSLIKARVPYRLGSCVVRVNGDERVEEATIAKLDAQGVPIKGSMRKIAVDTVVVGYG